MKYEIAKQLLRLTIPAEHIIEIPDGAHVFFQDRRLAKEAASKVWMPGCRGLLCGLQLTIVKEVTSNEN